MGAWVAGHNLPGYLPESDIVAVATWKEGVAAMVADAQHYADTDDEANDAMAESDWADEDYGSMRATVDSILADDGPTVVDQPFTMCIKDNDGRTIAFWVVWESGATPDEES